MFWLLLAGASLVATAASAADYRLGVDAQAMTVELRLAGDADGETRLTVPAGTQPAVSGARAEAPDATHLVLRHKPGAKLTVRYRLRAEPAGVAALGESVFAAPEGREAEAATFRWAKLPKGWRGASDLDVPGRALSVEDVARSVVLAGPGLQVAEREGLKVAELGADPGKAADALAPAIGAVRAYWGDASQPAFVGLGAFPAGLDRGGGLALPSALAADAGAVARAQTAAWIPRRTGRAPAPAWITEGLAGVVADRALLRAGLISARDAAARLDAADHAKGPASPGALLALKWDEEIRLKTGGKADLDDVVLRMRDHYRQFAPGQGPDLVTGLVSAVWVIARIDIRPDIARYAERGDPIPLPEELFGGCLQARVTVTPAFDAGFDTTASFAAKRLIGVRRRGPAWNSGLRDGLALDAWSFQPGDTTRQIELTLRPAKAKGRPRKVAFWPYGDADSQSRKLQLLPTMSDAGVAACGKKMGGL